LLASGADHALLDKEGKTALDLAAESADSTAFTYLLPRFKQRVQRAGREEADQTRFVVAGVS
jgi:hypothetical protein